ncbi:hypothetical protein BJ165DRAFT_1529657 [Panaeolus papilionaceus]|nr:hypothetical protein BJ165DRAFT_1529657 [Panaeolus papilionaceus]
MDYGVQATIDPRFQAYVQSNDLPRREVLEEAARFKVRWLSDLQTLDKEIQTLQRKRDVVKNGLWAFDCILAPIRHLPDDVLVDIFCHCIPTTRNARPFVSEAPLLLTLVCKKWRTITMSAPRLWTTLHIPLLFNYSPRVWSPNRNTHDRTSHMDAHTIPTDFSPSPLYAARDVGLDQWLRISAPLSLSISLYYPTSQFILQDDPAERFRRATLDLVARYADRISALEADVPQKVVNELGKAIMQYFDFKTLPRLRRLLLSSQNTSETMLFTGTTEILSAQSLKCFIAAESLNELSLNIGDINQVLSYVPPNVTIFSVHGVTDPYDAYNALRRLHRLERCHLNVSDGWSSYFSLAYQRSLAAQAEEMSSLPALLPNLHTLSIKGTLLDIQSLCKPLELPYISTLFLDISFDNTIRAVPGSMPQSAQDRSNKSATLLPYPPESTEQLCTFLIQHTSLSSLSIFTAFIQPTELQSILSAVPQLERLVLHSIQSARPGVRVHDKAQVVHLGSSEGHIVIYTLDPLLTQQRVLSGSGDEFVTLDTPLLPCLRSFEWHQFHENIPIDPFVSFINNRLFQLARPSARISVTPSHSSDSKARQALTVPLKDIKIRLLRASDVDDVESRIIQHAEEEGLKRGVDFHLNIAVCPSVVPSMSDGPRYSFSEGYSRANPVYVAEDHLVVDQDVTWPWVEF